MTETLPPQDDTVHTAICVLDTHVVLEAFWFVDPRARAVRHALVEGRLAWWATPAMRAELARVLQRLPERFEVPDREYALASFDRLVVLRDDRPSPVRLRSSDPDDQMFLDLALGAGARWLFTRDRALLHLARRAAAYGCSIVPPERSGAPAPDFKAGSAPGT